MSINIYDIYKKSAYKLSLYCYISHEKFILEYDGFDVKGIYCPNQIADTDLKIISKLLNENIGHAPFDIERFKNMNINIDTDKRIAEIILK